MKTSLKIILNDTCVYQDYILPLMHNQLSALNNYNSASIAIDYNSSLHILLLVAFA